MNEEKSSFVVYFLYRNFYYNSFCSRDTRGCQKAIVDCVLGVVSQFFTCTDCFLLNLLFNLLNNLIVGLPASSLSFLQLQSIFYNFAISYPQKKLNFNSQQEKIPSFVFFPIQMSVQLIERPFSLSCVSHLSLKRKHFSLSFD